MASASRGHRAARTGSARAWAAILRALGNAYGRPRRSSRKSRLDLAVIALLAEGRGERQAARWTSALIERFVDWNEIRVAKPRDLSTILPDAPSEPLKKMLAFLQAIYEAMGGLDLSKFSAMKLSEARAWLDQFQILQREEVEAVLMVCLGAPTIPAGEALTRVCRRLGLAPRKATRARVHRMALKSLSPGTYRDFYDLVGEHAAERCRAEKPDCRRCALRTPCRSRGKW